MVVLSYLRTEPCPYCGARVIVTVDPLTGAKKCPNCGGLWFESDGGGKPTVPTD
ncbi:MAG: hypothetical protein NZ957_06190 [Thaumarchaeota archaeon]|nr:hypothetical protein [Candidatus Calditenuaceae archaeon]